MRRLGRDEARRIAIRAQLLDADRPRDLASVVEQLTFLHLAPTAAVAPSADLVAWSRLGDSYEPSQLQRALEVDRTLFEHRSQEGDTEPPVVMVRPMADLGLYLADMAAWPHGSQRRLEWMADNDAFRTRVLDLLRASGPLASRDIPDTCVGPWESLGWTRDKNVTQMLDFLSSRGEVAVSGRRGRQRLWDLAERVYPPRVKVVPAAAAKMRCAEKRLRALVTARPPIVGDAGTTVEIEGTVGEWRVDPQANADGFAGRTALLSPFDRLGADLPRGSVLFDFSHNPET